MSREDEYLRLCSVIKSKVQSCGHENLMDPSADALLFLYSNC